ncbi:hypothetical protein BsIDN1_04270 [Bacillus safensis]|uniref:Bacterial Ig domain-containing protein n=1 Tax=Bacillus safensis TaxID=561879 RepID=A0A5S9M4I1_BACIA|nr:hypothetical protein BsIDN1_04270 [Bacillus safensis]
MKNKSKKVIKTVKTNSKGAFTAQIKPQKAKTVLYVTASDVRKRESKSVKVVVKKKKKRTSLSKKKREVFFVFNWKKYQLMSIVK